MQVQPNNTDLKLISDNRSGNKLEILLYTYNEEIRILNILSFYGKEFDIVIMDGGSSDGTCDVVRQYGGTVYSRVGASIGENHFVHYVNNLTKSGRCFTMQCDEFIEITELQKASELLLEGGCILGRRIDWFYGVKARKATCILPRGFRRGEAIYNPTNLHDTLSYAKSAKNTMIVNVQHLHVYNMRDDYGKFGNYIYHEVLQLRKAASPTKSFLIRFLRLGRNLQLGFVRFPKNLWLILFLLAQFFASLFLFLMCLIEQSKLSTKEEQFKQYRGKYRVADE